MAATPLETGFHKMSNEHLAALTLALEFYADRENYRGGQTNDGDGHFDRWGYNILDDDGSIARAALLSLGHK